MATVVQLGLEDNQGGVYALSYSGLRTRSYLFSLALERKEHSLNIAASRPLSLARHEAAVCNLSVKVSVASCGGKPVSEVADT